METEFVMEQHANISMDHAALMNSAIMKMHLTRGGDYLLFYSQANSSDCKNN